MTTMTKSFRFAKQIFGYLSANRIFEMSHHFLTKRNTFSL